MNIEATFFSRSFFSFNAYETCSFETVDKSESDQFSVDREEVCIELIYFHAIIYSDRYNRIMLCACCITIIAILYILFDVNYFLRIFFTLGWARLFTKKKKLLDTMTIYGKFSS